VHNELSFY